MFLSFFDDVIQNSFLQNAVISICLISIISGIIGSLLVSNRIVFVGGGVAHCAYGGIGVAIYYGFSVILGAIFSSLFVAISLAIVKKKFEEHIDVFSAILWSFGMSVGLLFINLSPSGHADIESYLFGSIISADSDILYLMFWFDCILLLFISMYYREILSISYDYEFCLLKKIHVNIFIYAIFIFIAIGVILSMQISGLILVLSMLSIPAYISNLFVKTLLYQMIISSILSFIFMFIGLLFSYYYNVLSGASITFVSVFGMLIAFVFYKIRHIYFRFCK